MDRIYHPVTGESGYFTSDAEKEIIDAVIISSFSHESDYHD